MCSQYKNTQWILLNKFFERLSVIETIKYLEYNYNIFIFRLYLVCADVYQNATDNAELEMKEGVY